MSHKKLVPGVPEVFFERLKQTVSEGIQDGVSSVNLEAFLRQFSDNFIRSGKGQYVAGGQFGIQAADPVNVDQFSSATWNIPNNERWFITKCRFFMWTDNQLGDSNWNDLTLTLFRLFYNQEDLISSTPGDNASSVFQGLALGGFVKTSSTFSSAAGSGKHCSGDIDIYRVIGPGGRVTQATRRSAVIAHDWTGNFKYSFFKLPAQSF